MLTLLAKDIRLNRLPIVVAIALAVVPYIAATILAYQVYAPEMPPRATIADYLASAAVFGLLFSIASGAILAGNSVACERMDDSAVFLACQPVSRFQTLASKAVLVAVMMVLIWTFHCVVTHVIAPLMDKDAQPYVKLDGPTLFAASGLVVAIGTGWLTSILGRNPSMAICAGLACAFLVPWSVYLVSMWFSVAPDDSVILIRSAQWAVGLLAAAVGTCIYLRRVEP